MWENKRIQLAVLRADWINWRTIFLFMQNLVALPAEGFIKLSYFISAFCVSSFGLTHHLSSPLISTFMLWVPISLSAVGWRWLHFPWPLNLFWQLIRLKLKGRLLLVLNVIVMTCEITSDEHNGELKWLLYLKTLFYWLTVLKFQN